MMNDETDSGELAKKSRLGGGNPALLGAVFVLLILDAICLPLGDVRAWVCRAPWVYLPFRFAVAWLVGLPALAWIRRGKANGWLKAYLVVLILALIASPLLLIFQLLFGFGPALQHDPLGIILPVVAAMFPLLKTAKAILRSRGLSQWSILPIPLAMAAGLLVIGYVALALPPNTYPDYAAYLSRKYGLVVTIRDQHLLERTAARPVAGAPAPPPGLAIKYLVFGERAIDYSALLD